KPNPVGVQAATLNLTTARSGASAHELHGERNRRSPRHLRIKVSERLRRHEPALGWLHQGEPQVGPAEQGESDPERPPGFPAVDAKQNRNEQDAERHGEEHALPCFIGISESAEADSEEQDHAQKTGDVESKIPHDVIAPSELHRSSCGNLAHKPKTKIA